MSALVAFWLLSNHGEVRKHGDTLLDAKARRFVHEKVRFPDKHRARGHLARGWDTPDWAIKAGSPSLRQVLNELMPVSFAVCRNTQIP
jgi:hypothetical protein